MTSDLPTAEWRREQAVVFANAAASMPQPFEDDPKYAAALRIAARVLDDQTQSRLEEIIMGAPTLDGNDFTDERAAARAILAYLKEKAV